MERQRRKLIHTTRIPIRWGDMDAFGHVNNTVYFRYAEQARVEWLESAAGRLESGQGTMPVIVNASCTFLIPLNHPGTVEVRMYAGQAGRSSLETFYDMGVVGNDKIYAEGAAKLVWMDAATGRSVPLPDAIRAFAANGGDNA